MGRHLTLEKENKDFYCQLMSSVPNSCVRFDNCALAANSTVPPSRLSQGDKQCDFSLGMKRPKLNSLIDFSHVGIVRGRRAEGFHVTHPDVSFLDVDSLLSYFRLQVLC